MFLYFRLYFTNEVWQSISSAQFIFGRVLREDGSNVIVFLDPLHSSRVTIERQFIKQIDRFDDH
jgi:hypothetical protein